MLPFIWGIIHILCIKSYWLIYQTWDVTRLDNCFLPHKISSVLSIPLNRNRIQDSVIWSFNQSGQYSVKSEYKFLAEESNNLDLRESSGGLEDWRRIWGFKVQNKVKNLLWQACKNSIPSKQNLVRRKVILDDICDQCQQAAEDTLHVVWSCPRLSPIWDFDSMWNFHRSTTFSRFGDLVTYVIDRGKKNLDLFAVMVWTTWYRRNLLRTSSKPFSINQVRINVVATYEEFIRNQPRMAPVSSWSQTSVSRVPPRQPIYKVNFDGAMFNDDRKAGVRVVTRNNLGQVMASMTQKYNLPSSVEEVEAMVAVRAIISAQELGFSSIVHQLFLKGIQR